MTSYLTIIGLSIFSVFFDIFRGVKKYKKIIFLILVFLISLFVGFRSNLPDYTSYVGFFNNLSTNLIEAVKTNDYSIFFTIFSVLLKLIYDNIYFYFFIIAIVTIYLTFNAYKKLSDYYLISIYLYLSSIFLFGPMIQIRNALALGIIMNSVVYIASKEKYKYFSLILVAFLFHWSSIIFFPLYYINKFKFKKNRSLILFFLLPIIVFLIGNNLPTILKIISDLLPLEKPSEKIMFYLNSPKYGQTTRNISPRMFSNLIILFITIIFEKSLRSTQKYYDILLSLYFLNTFFRLLVIYMGIFLRIARLFEFVEPIILTSFILLIKNKFIRLIYIHLILLYGILIYLNLITGPVFVNYINVLF